jgi:aspartate racemase
VILGCAEIMLLVKPEDSDSAVPLFDTTTIHVQAAVDQAIVRSFRNPAMG